jgi:hypothetical protein
MATHATGIAEIRKWDEKPYRELGDGRKLTKASVTQTFTGDIEGEGTVEYLMVYPNENSASYVGLQLVIGTLGGKTGSFVLQLTGVYGEGVASGSWFVVAGSGTGELANLRGEGGFSAPHGSQARYTLDYRWE